MSRSAFGRRRRSGGSRVLQFLVGVLLVLAVGGSAYRVGLSASQALADKMEADLERSRETNLELRQRLVLVERSSRRAEMALDSLRARYASDVPSGELATLMTKVEEQLRAGADADRLALLIAAAGAVDACAGEATTKRFVPSTPISAGPQSAIRFDERIIVSGSGMPARNEQGLAEAWFDPAEPIRLDFRTLGGERHSVERHLPLHHEMIVHGRLYRFVAIAGESPFLEVTAQACELPKSAVTVDPEGILFRRRN